MTRHAPRELGPHGASLHDDGARPQLRATTIALVSAAGVDVPQLDDRWLVDALVARGVEVVTARWDDPAVDWAAFDAVCLRSCWDYHLRYREFLAWFERADRAGVRWINPAPAVRWNSHKRYLLDLRAAGLPVPPLQLVAQGTAFDTVRFLAETDWPDVVIKPAVSASAHRTWRASAETPEISAARVTEMLAEGDVILQRFVPDVAKGEWSVVCVDDAVSHAVRRRPKAGEFRSQRENGATVTAEDPPPAVVATARAALAYASRHGAPCLARLDIVEAEDGPVVMEIELIEPVLFFGYAAGAADRAADALHRRARRDVLAPAKVHRHDPRLASVQAVVSVTTGSTTDVA